MRIAPSRGLSSFVLRFWCAVGFPVCAVGANPSLCLTEPSGCDEPGSTVNVQVALGAGDAAVVGVQLQLEYDPTALAPLEVLPGFDCDPTSPFRLEIHEAIDEAAGVITYAVGVDFTQSTGTNQAATVACFRFLPRGVSTSPIRLLVGTGPSATRLSDNAGHIVPIDNSASCPTGNSQLLSEQQAVVEDVCECTTDSDCVTLNGDCHSGVCDAGSLLCRVQPIHEGLACNDFNDCTTADRCASGVCVGSGCNNQSMCFGEGCLPVGSMVLLPVRLGEGDPVITGGQFSVQWDVTGLQLVDIRPGSACDSASPFSFEVNRVGDGSDGELFYAVGVTPGNPGTHGPATLACLYFNVLDEQKRQTCIFEGINPFHTRLVDDRGQRITVFNDGSCGSGLEFPFLACGLANACEIPAVSEWGLIVMVLLLLIYSKLALNIRGSMR